MMVQAYSCRADGSVNPVHLPGCALITGSAMVCTCAEIEREQVAGLPDLDEWQQGMARLGAAVTEVSKSLGSLALLIKLHGWLVNKRQVDAETVALTAVGRLPVTVTGVLVQVDLRPDKPPYVVLREEYGSEIPVAPESVRVHVTSLPKGVR